MWARKRIDLGWSDLMCGAVRALMPADRARLRQAVEACWSPKGDSIACLSVRSGFDLFLSALDLPRGSEVLVSALTIGDMVRIIEDHGLVPLPVDLDPDTMFPDVECLRRAITPSSRAILVAHLFGGRSSLAPILDVARRHDLVIIEDCAQAFAGAAFTGHPAADASMFSFGPIKTATALGGALMRVRDASLLSSMRKRQADYPVQPRLNYAERIAKYSLLKLVSTRPIYSAFIRACRLLRWDYDRLVNGAVRGFAGSGFFERIRRQPSTPLLALMLRRLRHVDSMRLESRAAIGRSLVEWLDGVAAVPGAAATSHVHWVLPVLLDDPPQVIVSLRQAGFDATQGQSLVVVDPPADRPELNPSVARDVHAKVVYLPCYPEMPERVVRRMAAALTAAIAADAAPAGSAADSLTSAGASHAKPTKAAAQVATKRRSNKAAV